MLPLALLHALTGAAAALMVEHTLGLARRQRMTPALQRMTRRMSGAADAVARCQCELCEAWWNTQATDALAEYTRAANVDEPDR